MNQDRSNHSYIPHAFFDLMTSQATNGAEKAVLAYVARKTWGFNKKSDQISYSQFVNKCGLSRRTVSTTLLRLRLVKLLALVKKGTSRLASNEYFIDLTDYQDKLVKLGALVKFDDKKLVQVGIHTKESITKEKRNENFSAQDKVDTSQANPTDLPPLTPEGFMKLVNSGLFD